MKLSFIICFLKNTVNNENNSTNIYVRDPNHIEEIEKTKKNNKKLKYLLYTKSTIVNVHNSIDITLGLTNPNEYLNSK